MFASGDGFEGRTDAEKSTDRCQHCEYHQRRPHRRWRLVRHVRAVRVSSTMPVRSDVLFNVFVHWSNMLAGFVTWTITRRWQNRIVRRETFVVSRSMRLVCFAARVTFEESFFAPE